jgi:hypothetical protein
MQKTILLPLIALVLLMTSCDINKELYSPKGLGQQHFINNTPMLDSTQDMKLTGTLGFNHVEGQIAYSPINHFAIIGDYIAYTDTITHNYEVGFGYYGKIKSLGYELYGTFSKAMRYHFNDYKNDNPIFVSYSGTNYFISKSHSFSILSNINLPINNHWKFALAAKYQIAVYDFFQFHQTIVSYDNFISTNPPIKSISDKYHSLQNPYQQFIYIAPTFQYRNKNFIFFSQLSICTNISMNGGITAAPYYMPLLWSNGIAIQFNWKKLLSKKFTKI